MSCDQCGFDSDLYKRPDAISSQWIVPAVLRAAIEGLDDEALVLAPAGHAQSIRGQLDDLRVGARACLGALGEESAEEKSSPVLADLELVYKAIEEQLVLIDESVWPDSAARLIAHEAMHRGVHALWEIGRIRHALGHGATSGTGTLTQINVSGGGVPKLPVDSVTIDGRGVQGDSQNDRRHHGRPVQAVCLWSADVIADLAAHGHPIAAGNAGENLTVGGIDWPSLRPGSQLQIGELRLLVTAHAIPCAKNAQWFADRDFNRMLHDRNPGFSRLYAQPITNGKVATGDHVVVEGG